MSQQSGGQQKWTGFDSRTRRWYLYESHTGTIVFQDGERVPRTSFASAGTQASSSTVHLSTSPSGSTNRYPLTAGPSNVSNQSNYHRSTVQIAGYPQPQQPHPDRSRQDTHASIVNDFARLSVQPNPSQPNQTAQAPPSEIERRSWEDDGQSFISVRNPNNQVRTTLQTGPSSMITDPHLLRNGITARSMLMATEGNAERLFEGYHKRDQPRRFFAVGKVFLVLWVEPAGESNTLVTTLEPGTSVGRYGERVFSKVRRFVVIREGDNYCSALPIMSYGRRGVSKHGVKKSEHGIIYTGKVPPAALNEENPERGEQGMRPTPIRVVPDDKEDKLDAVSRIDYGKVHTVQHNIKVKKFGKVHENSLSALLHQFRNVWSGEPSVPGPSQTNRRDYGSTGGKPQTGKFNQSGDSRGRTLPRHQDEDYEDDDGEPQNRASRSTVDLQRYARNAVEKLQREGHTREQATELVRMRLAQSIASDSPDDDVSDDEEGGEEEGGEDEEEEPEEKEDFQSRSKVQNEARTGQPRPQQPVQGISRTSAQAPRPVKVGSSQIRNPTSTTQQPQTVPREPTQPPPASTIQPQRTRSNVPSGGPTSSLQSQNQRNTPVPLLTQAENRILVRQYMDQGYTYEQALRAIAQYQQRRSSS